MQSRWRFRKEADLSTILQLCLMASLVLGSWMNLEKRLEVLQHDVRQVLARQEMLHVQSGELADRTLGHEYRLAAVEAAIAGRKYGGE